MFKGDKPRIRQIIFNLISNAVKFTHDGSITLLFNHTLTVKKETGITIQIKDSGIGIRQERLEKIFDPFIQAESSTTRQYGGTGLGLAIVKQLVDVMGGDISVNSTEGKGTTFTIVIPLETSIKQATVENKDHSPRTNIEETKTPTNLSILIAEDNKVNALVAKMFCQRLGHQVTIAENGQIALDILQESSFDLIIMDNHMPIMDGITATQIIRNKLKLSTVIFACTADVFQEAHDNFIAAGANYILTKPLQEQSFLDAINHHKIKIERNKSSHQPKTNIIELKRYSKDKITTLALTEAELTLEPLIEICGDDIEIRNEFLTSFINTSEESITSLITAYDKKD
ncbi:ATP-binding protein, partial [Aliivibrio sifiae]